jgi:hypothetical protein
MICGKYVLDNLDQLRATGRYAALGLDASDKRG